jgi:hypothetical protein
MYADRTKEMEYLGLRSYAVEYFDATPAKSSEIVLL